MIPTPSEPEPLKGHQYSSSLTIIRIEHCGSPAAKCKRIILLGDKQTRRAAHKQRRWNRPAAVIRPSRACRTTSLSVPANGAVAAVSRRQNAVNCPLKLVPPPVSQSTLD
ncbi:hypothetical protein V2G26_006529 [Clonostachys chloroleuca]